MKGLCFLISAVVLLICVEHCRSQRLTDLFNDHIEPTATAEDENPLYNLLAPPRKRFVGYSGFGLGAIILLIKTLVFGLIRLFSGGLGRVLLTAFRSVVDRKDVDVDSRSNRDDRRYND